ncbi:histidine kinase [Neisseria mucosa]|jgi:sensor histidine kinase|uniref:Sensor protein n=2 Tax=Neisseriaceae TaxID=481 RepID=A0A0C1H1X5_9NEIS|nr:MULTISPECIES: histidine kinase [Neisseriaceae]OFJ57496.1 ATPase [Neisseria sp. HMSC073B07]OFT24573.1 ATPase [Neisseria sp. HMSC03D10]OHR40256.1 ATPase [Neisseria sp. HMSC064F04]AVR78433.1 HAMP domain-containing protein [Neisseria mucosa]KIC08122.1 ATPase [Morococcus cerebrosus]
MSFTFRFLNRLSLSSRLKLLTILWVGSALLSVILTLVLSWRLQNAATVIEDAGNLRTQVYRLAYMVGERAPKAQINNQIREFEQNLNRISQSNAIHPLMPSETPPAYDLIQTALIEDWKANIQPVLRRYERPDQIKLYRFAANIELFLQAMEHANEKNTLWLRRFQMIMMGMIFAAAGLMIIWHYAWIIRPLETLRDGVKTISQGRFGVQIDTDQISEFAQVNKGFNQMSSRLKTLYTDLEGQVARQTQDLARQNRDLTLLYQTTRDLHQTFTPQQAAEEFLKRTLPAVSAEAGSIRLWDNERKRTDIVASIGLPDDSDEPDTAPDKTALKHAVFPISYQEEELGVLNLYFSDDLKPDNNDNELLRTLSGQLGVSIVNSRLEQERRLLAVLQERNLIAQGLHDSIAQALTFLNLQVQMLESAFYSNQKEQAEENIRFIKDGVQECYEDVRELLLNFRTKISNKDFPEAVSALLTRFERQTKINVSTEWRDEGAALNNDEQLQIIFILQESLSNIRKHALARNVTVSIDNRQDFTLIIRDDGVGFDPAHLDTLSGEHVGMGIMRERAQRIHAELEVSSKPDEGTTVTLTLPKHKRTFS